jgi:hypothetical protein
MRRDMSSSGQGQGPKECGQMRDSLPARCGLQALEMDTRLQGEGAEGVSGMLRAVWDAWDRTPATYPEDCCWGQGGWWME